MNNNNNNNNNSSNSNNSNNIIDIDMNIGYIHIWKNGGTYVGNECNTYAQCGYDCHYSIRNNNRSTNIQKQKMLTGGKSKIEIKLKSLFTVVRNPIDHFLSGWSECSYRQNKQRAMMEKNSEKQSFLLRYSILMMTTTGGIQNYYDKSIIKWLDRVDSTKQNAKCPCLKHSWPQSRFILDHSQWNNNMNNNSNDNNNETSSNVSSNELNFEYQIDPRLHFIGDLNELEVLFKIFKADGTSSTSTNNYNNTNKSSTSGNIVAITNNIRNATLNEIKGKYFSWRKAKKYISNSTLLRICEYVAIDYYVFDFLDLDLGSSSDSNNNNDNNDDILPELCHSVIYG